jgi:hypothetical protein
MFTLGPDERFGYFIYPLGLVGWLALTRPAKQTPDTVPAKPTPDTVPAELKNRTARAHSARGKCVPLNKPLISPSASVAKTGEGSAISRPSWPAGGGF